MRSLRWFCTAAGISGIIMAGGFSFIPGFKIWLVLTWAILNLLVSTSLWTYFYFWERK